MDAEHTRHGPRDRALVAIVLGALLLSQVTALALGLWHPDGDLVPYIEAHRDSWWAWHTYSGMILVLTAGAYTATLWWLVPGRGRGFALAGGLLISVAAASFGAGLVAEASTHWYAGSSTLSDSQSHDLLTYIEDNGDHLVAPILIGTLLGVVGPLIAGIGLWLSRSLAWWAIALFVVGSVAGTAFGPATILSLAAYALISWTIWTRIPDATDERTGKATAAAVAP